ncbi:MAG: L,D-transpeptidase family protein [Hyphomicrobium sp.]
MYRVVTRMAAIGLAGIILSAGFEARSARALGAESPIGSLLAAAGLPASFETTLTLRLNAAIAEAAIDSQDARWLQQLRSFYIARRGAPVWVDAKGFNSNAYMAIKELANAGEFGLDPAAFQQPASLSIATDHDNLAIAEIAVSRAVVTYAHHAKGGRIEPSSLSLWLERTPLDMSAAGVMIDIISGENAGAAMRAMHPQSPAFEVLRQAYVAARNEIASPRTIDPQLVIPLGDTIKLGEYHPDVLIIRQRLNMPGAADRQSQFDEALANKLHDVVSSGGVKTRWGRVDDKVRRFLNKPPAPPSKEQLARILANMERWRWLPPNLGETYIWNNLPEYMTRFVSNGAVLHEERIIVGQSDTQTPVFSDQMRHVVFQPEWGVPPSIKINDLLPKLRSGDYNVLERRGMRILGLSGREVRPQRFNWAKTDIRDVGIYQRSGDGNPLGVIKFLFPNKHHVYMHDTNNRALFSASDRTFSHGCIRVRDPLRFAEIILGRDQGWTMDDIKRLLKDRKKPNNSIDLVRPIPVHNVYFTMIPGEGRTLVELDDIYGHDRRVTQALSGVSPQKIAQSDPARSQLRELDEAAPPVRKRRTASAGRRGGDDD